ncbi:Myosin-binding protein H [Amphibalanus amphitrite]|uniref:Myosin-binding protein H n=1 Tax=Amphibalanus amphitrite TaxID=1232801 RepID=A0A6A4VBY4_AMPAM|nr:Myosin-binding protein H [Amphibalanus amphitrite]
MRREVSMRQESSTTRVHQEISHQVVSQSQQVRREFRLSDLPDPGGPRRGQRALPASGRQYSPSPEPESIPKRRETPEPSERHYKRSCGGRWTAEAVESALQRSRLNGRAKQANGRHSAPAEKAPKENGEIGEQNRNTVRLSSCCARPCCCGPLADHTVRPGGVTQLRLIVDALPPPSVTWYKDGRQLEPRPDAPYAISEDGGVCTLSLPRAHPDDSGVYCCVAANHLGSVCSEALLAVAGEL